MASANNSAQGSSSADPEFQRFLAANVHPAYAEAGPSDDSAPEKETMGPGISGVLSAPRPQSSVADEVHGARYAPQTTIAHGNPSQPGMPAGWVSAKTPQ